MKILSIAKKILLRSLRDINTMLLMCAMPLVIIFVLGLALDSQLGNGNGIELSDMHVTYAIVGEEGILSQSVEKMMDELLTEGSTYEIAEDKDEQIENLRVARITAYMEIDENSETITLYKNNRVNTTSSVLESALRAFTARYNTMAEIAKANPALLQTILSNDESKEFINITGLNEKYQPNAMDYYGVIMTVLFILYGFMTPLEEVILDKKEGLTSRAATTSVKPVEVFAGKVLGYVSVASIRAAIVISVSAIVYHVDWGAQPIYPFILIFALIIVMTSLGMMLGEAFKSNSAASAFGHLFIVISAFFGGAYLALEDMGPLSSLGKYFSLIWWANVGITNQIYANDFGTMKTAIAIFLGLSLLFLGIAVVIMNTRKENVNG